jgi:transcriptional regulator with XRE-family HTH domain
MDKNSGFAKRLKELRQKKKISQTELGKIVGLHFTHISRYERGLSQPTAGKLRKLAEFLGVTVDYLIEGKISEVAESNLGDKDLLKMFKEIETFEEKDKIVIKQLIDAFIAKKRIQELARV